jgi:hypothetical protein
MHELDSEVLLEVADIDEDWWCVDATEVVGAAMEAAECIVM